MFLFVFIRQELPSTDSRGVSKHCLPRNYHFEVKHLRSARKTIGMNTSTLRVSSVRPVVKTGEPLKFYSLLQSSGRGFTHPIRDGNIIGGTRFDIAQTYIRKAKQVIMR